MLAPHGREQSLTSQERGSEARARSPQSGVPGRLGSRRLASRSSAELLRPPFGLAAVEVLLQLGDVHREVALARGQVGLELGAGLLALLEPLLADFELRLQLRLAEVETRLALLELLRAAREDVLALVERFLLALVAAARREDRLLCLVQRGLARGQLVVAGLQPPLAELVDLRLARLLQLAAQRGFGAVEFRFARDQR